MEHGNEVKVAQFALRIFNAILRLSNFCF